MKGHRGRRVEEGKGEDGTGAGVWGSGWSRGLIGDGESGLRG